ncbi:MAG: calcium-binding protein [Pseudomonadota bacterium]
MIFKGRATVHKDVWVGATRVDRETVTRSASLLVREPLRKSNRSDDNAAEVGLRIGDPFSGPDLPGEMSVTSHSGLRRAEPDLFGDAPRGPARVDKTRQQLDQRAERLELYGEFLSRKNRPAFHGDKVVHPDGVVSDYAFISSALLEFSRGCARVTAEFTLNPSRQGEQSTTLVVKLSGRLVDGSGEFFLEPPRGTRGDDSLFGSRGRDRIEARAGDDHVEGDRGDDVIKGGRGQDFLSGGDGEDRIDGGADGDVVAGGNGDDRLFGGDGDDRMTGGRGDDRLAGGEGDDRLEGNEGRDTLLGGTGEDRLFGGDQADLLRGGEGDDELRGDGGPDSLFGDAGDDALFGGGGDDLLFGGDGADALKGARGDDSLDGGAGRDRLFGGDGRDTLRAGETAEGDRLVGGDGRDLLIASGGDAALTGGGMQDVFRIEGVGGAFQVRIADFESGLDALELVAAGDALPEPVRSDGEDGLRLVFDETVLVFTGLTTADPDPLL